MGEEEWRCYDTVVHASCSACGSFPGLRGISHPCRVKSTTLDPAKESLLGDQPAPAAGRDFCAFDFCEGSCLPLFITQPEGSVSCNLSLHRERHKASAEILR